MNIIDLFSLQGTLFAMMLIGAWLKKRGIIDAEGERCLTDLCVNIVIPCNIFKSCLIEFNMSIFKSCSLLLISAVILQALCLTLNQFIFNRYESQQKKVLQYCTIVPMSGFLVHPWLAYFMVDLISLLRQMRNALLSLILVPWYLSRSSRILRYPLSGLSVWIFSIRSAIRSFSRTLRPTFPESQR